MDASPEIGGGHIMRCLTLANTLSDHGWQCAFALAAETARSFPHIKHQGFPVSEINGPEDGQPGELERAWPDGCDLMVVDHYGLDAGFETACRPWARKIMVIDDLANRRHDCDYLLDQSTNRPAADYRGFVAEHTKMLVGADYALIRPEFWRIRQYSLNRRNYNTAPERVYIGFGATDPSNATAATLKALAIIEFDIDVDIALTEAAPNKAEIYTLLSSLPFPATLHIDHGDIAGLMAGADFAFGAAGSSALERCCLGLPTAFLVTAGNQRSVADALVKTGAAIEFGSNEAAASGIGRIVSNIFCDPARLKVMSHKAALVCDGRGAMRTAQALSPPRAKDGLCVALRPATMDDAELILEWQKAPETRRYARNPAVPERHEHMCWMAGQLNNPNSFCNIILHGDVPAGVMRLDQNKSRRSSDGALEISVFVSPGKYRLGLASAALDLARALIPDVDLIAHVQRENKASRALFKNAGFACEGEWFVSEGQRR